MISAGLLDALVLSPLADVRAALGPRFHRLTVLAPRVGACGLGTLRVLRIRFCDVPGTDEAYEVVAGYERYDEAPRRRSAEKS